ncbi:MAG: hypothetical protein ACRETW_08335 [Stenotrophobium sp.]
MNFIRWWTSGIMLLAGAMFVTLCVVCLQYYLYMDLEPSLRTEWPGLLQSTLMFLALSVLGGVAFWAMVKNNRWLWPSQALLLVGSSSIFWIFWELLSGKL